MAAWVPSISWSTALPMSCRSPARLALRSSRPIWAAMMPIRLATSMECMSTFWEKL